MSEIEYKLNNKKVCYPDFIDFVKENSLKEFLHHFQYPFRSKRSVCWANAGR